MFVTEVTWLLVGPCVSCYIDELKVQSSSSQDPLGYWQYTDKIIHKIIHTLIIGPKNVQVHC